MADNYKCPSLLGRIFGHKFIKRTWDGLATSNFCLRCGRWDARGR